MNDQDKFGHFSASVLVNTFVLLIPYLMPTFYGEIIPERKAALSVAVFFLTVSLSCKKIFPFAGLLIGAILYIALYGAIKPDHTITDYTNRYVISAAGGFIVLVRNKWILHMRQGEKFFEVK